MYDESQGLNFHTWKNATMGSKLMVNVLPGSLLDRCEVFSGNSEYTVGNPGRESNASWAIARGAHKKPTYAQMVKAYNQFVSEVRKEVSNRVVSEVSILSSTSNHSHIRKRRT